MPLYRYQPAATPCRICGTGFDSIQAASEAALTECPTCGQQVNRVTTQVVSSPKLTRPPSVSEARSAGFKIYKRTTDGNFERQ